jgi:hypothetical protein
MKCKRCGNDVPHSRRDCPACGEDNGFPNVRLAASDEETAALAQRLKYAEASADAGGYQGILTDFGEIILNSKAVIARPLGAIQDLIDDERITYTSYHLQLEAQARIPNEGFDRVRTQFEAALFPNFHQEIRYAALTLNDRWLKPFGPFAMILRSWMIEQRATLFEENPWLFATRHQILLNQPLPHGYRSTWEKRGDLARAKYYPKITAATERVEYADILMQDTKEPFHEDYMEVHIYGPFNRHAIEKVIGPEPKRREDKLLWRKLEKKCKAVGVLVETVK